MHACVSQYACVCVPMGAPVSYIWDMSPADNRRVHWDPRAMSKKRRMHVCMGPDILKNMSTGNVTMEGEVSVPVGFMAAAAFACQWMGQPLNGAVECDGACEVYEGHQANGIWNDVRETVSTNVSRIRFRTTEAVSDLLHLLGLSKKPGLSSETPLEEYASTPNVGHQRWPTDTLPENINNKKT
eukprot:GHVO01024049.1.p1 GENE.GHVO01024049.1~~GHVO01024049.1.p1  ORF type:complete len:184 (-),score=31.46 GHVO01024049.1:612-1163(-)